MSGLRLASIPAPPRDNLFATLLYSALARHGVRFVGEGGLSPWWLWGHRRRVDVLHLHWPEKLLARRTAVRTGLRTAVVLAELLLARVLGYRVAWTAHNLEPHEGESEAVVRIALRAVALVASDVFVMTPSAREEVATRLHRRRRVHVTPHGNYLGAYPDEITEDEARSRLGVSRDAFVHAMVGSLRAYKGVEDAVSAFDRVAGPDDVLLLAGRLEDGGLRSRVEAAAAADSRIHLHGRFLDNDELQVFFRAADVVLLPFRSNTTSGSLLLALSFGRPVIAADAGNVRDVVTPECGLLFAPGDVDGLERRMAQARDWDVEARGRAARARAGEFTWDAAAAAFARGLETA